MKILITLPVKIGFDGMTKQILSYGKYMDKSDVEIDLLSCRGYDTRMKHEVENAGFTNVYRMEYRDTNQIKYFFDLLKLIKKRKYDVVHANGQSATLAIEMLAAELAGCKVRVAHSHNSMCIHQKVHKLLKPLFKLTCNDAIACSNEAGQWLFGNRPYWILNNGVDVEKFAFNQKIRDEYRKLLNLSEKDIAVGNVAAFEPKKNQAFLVDIFGELKNTNYKLFLWGIDGSSKNVVLERIKESGLENKVFYMGTTNEMSNYLQAMDLMLLPSMYEGFPVTVVEWQANGLPCLVSNTVTHSCDITGLVKFLPIDEGIKIWVDSIKKYDNLFTDRGNVIYQQLLSTKGYDIVKNANELKKHYANKIYNRNMTR